METIKHAVLLERVYVLEAQMRVVFDCLKDHPVMLKKVQQATTTIDKSVFNCQYILSRGEENE